MGSASWARHWTASTCSDLCRSYLHALPGRTELTAVIYFSAVAHHRESRHAGTVARQVGYFAELEKSGVTVRLGHFKAKTLVCLRCGRAFTSWEEKETDVAIGAQLVDLVCRRACETAVLVTGDTDLVPAVQTARRLNGRACLVALQPYRRVNRELSRCTDKAMTIRLERYLAHQLP